MKTNFYNIYHIDVDDQYVFNYVIEARDVIEALIVIKNKVKKKKLILDKAEPEHYDYKDVGLMIQRIDKQDIRYMNEYKKLKNPILKQARKEESIQKKRKKRFKKGWKEYVIYEVDDYGRDIHLVKTFMAKNKNKALKIKDKSYRSGYYQLYSLNKKGEKSFLSIR